MDVFNDVKGEIFLHFAMDCLLGRRQKTYCFLVIAAGFGAGWDHINPTLFDAGHAADISVKGHRYDSVRT